MIEDQEWKPQFTKLQGTQKTLQTWSALQDSVWQRPVSVAPRHVAPRDPELEPLGCCH